MSFLTPPTSMALDDPDDIWVASNSSFSFHDNEDIFAAAMSDVTYNGTASSGAWQNMSTGNNAITSQAQQGISQDLGIDGIYRSVSESTLSGQCGEIISPSSSTKIRPFHEFDAIFAEKEEKPLLTFERLDNRLTMIEGRLGKLESLINTLIDKVEGVGARVQTVDGILKEVVRREIEAMEKVLQCVPDVPQ